MSKERNGPEMQNAEGLPPSSPDDLLAAFAGPAVLVNRFTVTVGANGVRLAFTEQQTQDIPPQFRTAVSMSIQDGIMLYKMLQKLLQGPEAALEKLMEEALFGAQDEKDG